MLYAYERTVLIGVFQINLEIQCHFIGFHYFSERMCHQGWFCKKALQI